jgi:hypothetical protein
MLTLSKITMWLLSQNLVLDEWDNLSDENLLK